MVDGNKRKIMMTYRSFQQKGKIMLINEKHIFKININYV